jgi:hypothetical protein
LKSALRISKKKYAMKICRFLSVVLLAGVFRLAGASDIDSIIFMDTFDVDGSLPIEWTEYNTSGQVTVVDGELQFDYSSDHSSAYRVFEADSGLLTFSFDVESTRNHVTTKMHLISSTGQYIASLVFGNADTFNIQYATSMEDDEPSDFAGALINGDYAKNTTYSISIDINFEDQTVDFYQAGIEMAEDIAFLEASSNFAKIDISQLYMFNDEGQFYFDNITLEHTYVEVVCATNHFADYFADEDLPSEWIEYNTTDSVRVSDGWMEFGFYTSETPTSAYRTFTPIESTGYLTLSFDMKSSRNYVVAKMNLLSSTGEYIASIVFGNNATKNIQYATSMVDGEPSDYDGALLDSTYASNTIYSISVTMSMSDQTLDFYNDGVLMASDIPFLGSSEDLYKIDISQNEMFNDEGQFYFDNISLDEDDVDYCSLNSAINTVDALTYSLVISPLYGYTQENYDVLLAAEEEAETFLDFCDVTQEQIDSAAEELLVAAANFDTTFQDEVVCTLYAEAQLSGDALSLNCGYYNGVLDDFDDEAVSFHLEEGYMLTVAQNVNGSGVSKVYVAQDEDLELNFLADLQKSISFVRVGPWRDVERRGASGGASDVIDALSASWFYDWGNSDSSMTECEYVPMNWSGGGIDKMTTLGNTMDFTHHLAFNEPDGEDQANMTTDKAIEKYEILQASGLRLGAPAVTDGSTGKAWRDEFMEKADSAGYRVDFIPVHYYKKQTAANFYTWLKDIYDTYGLPIWITEFSYGSIWNSSDLSESDILSGLTTYINMLDTASFVERYCVFSWGPTYSHSLMSERYPVTLNSIGVYYASHESPIAYTQEEYENGPDELLSITTNLTESNLSIYPNPVSNGILKLNYGNEFANQNLTVKLFNINGQELRVEYNSPQTIDITDFDNGVYLLRIEGVAVYISGKIIVDN